MKRVLATALFLVAGFAVEARHPLRCELIASASTPARRRRD